MSKFTVAIIQPNKVEAGDNCLNSLESCTTLVETDPEHMMETVVDSIGATPELIADTCMCYEDYNYRYQLCHVSMKDNGGKDNEDELNCTASYLCYGRVCVYGTAVLLRSKIQDSMICTPCSTTFNDITDVLKTKFVHTGVRVAEDGTVTEYTFKADPLEGREHDGWRWMEAPLCRFNCIVIFQTNPENAKVNKKITKFVGRTRLYGDVLVVTKTTENEYSNCDKMLFNKLLEVSGGSMSSRTLLKDEIDEDRKIDGLPVIVNRHRILENRYNNLKQTCHGCETSVTEKQICSGCYRVTYCSTECQKQDWKEHKIDCLYKVSGLNECSNDKL